MQDIWSVAEREAVGRHLVRILAWLFFRTKRLTGGVPRGLRFLLMPPLRWLSGEHSVKRRTQKALLLMPLHACISCAVLSTRCLRRAACGKQCITSGCLPELSFVVHCRPDR